MTCTSILRPGTARPPSRVAELGGAPIEEHRYEEGTVRVVADPEGHVFCLVEYEEGAGPA